MERLDGSVGWVQDWHAGRTGLCQVPARIKYSAVHVTLDLSQASQAEDVAGGSTFLMHKCTVYGQIPKGFCQIRRALDHSWSYKAYERQKSMEMSENNKTSK